MKMFATITLSRSIKHDYYSDGNDNLIVGKVLVTILTPRQEKI
jgi:hypothetical protein